ncbi:MOSC domain-containing protein [Reichenbachiella ulvae]|uniref:MOSC domain-containing protein n=1 Tax=Reichenbachiella ulvae TaxID=2980104 RepID=A0ABT3CU19_9BACT|nr:MOSC domain-containing protein [Reichenbachiella ulvae]MCV9387053.1 MOSC domain-containing protein [Reichenbachiella ulvae]
MKIVSTNLAKPQLIHWKGKEEMTGIYKVPTMGAIQLGKEDVNSDTVVDRRYHGGVDKACYLYSADHYDFWKAQYPDLEMPYGMFGENLTVEGMDETKLIVGEVYQVGNAKVQISEPREPCYKLGVKFGDQGILKKFIQTTYSGSYLRVLEEGEVKVGDTFELIEPIKNGLSIADVFYLLYAKSAEPEFLRMLLADDYLPKKLREKLLKKYTVHQD